MRTVLTLFPLLVGLISSDSPAPAPFHPLRYYIPIGYTILGRASADINGDGNKDWIIVLRNPYEK